MNKYRLVATIIILLLTGIACVQAQKKQVDSAAFYNKVKTYINPVLPDDHPNPMVTGIILV